MAYYVCPKHDDVTLFRDDEKQPSHSRLNEVRIEPPKHCEKCDQYYYRHECKKK